MEDKILQVTIVICKTRLYLYLPILPVSQKGSKDYNTKCMKKQGKGEL